MPWFTPRFVALSLPAVLVLSACATGQPRQDYAAQANELTAQVSAWRQLDDGVAASHLNDLISSPRLDQLLDKALANNPGLQGSLLTLEILRAERRKSGAERLPSIEAGISGEKTEGAESSYSSALTISWELDVWNKLGNGVRAAELDIGEQLALTQAVRDTLAAEVMQAWLGLIAEQHSLAIERRRLQTQQQNERFILQRYRNGLGNLEDLDSARSSTAGTRATIEQGEESYRQKLRSLRQLLGQSERLEFAPGFDYPDVILPLAELPQQTLQRRPDLKAAYLAIEAAGQRASAAYKDLLPSISLKASLSASDSSLSDALFSNPLWSLLTGLSAPLYQGGQLRAAAEIAELNVASAYQSYRETLLSAINEVEDAIGLERSLLQRQQHIEAALTTTRNNLTQYQRRYRSGLVDILDLLAVQQQSYDLELQLDDLIHQRLVNRIDLGLALGLGVRPSVSASVKVSESGVTQP
jgi:NodT family efflux transporter outer membrane factor (OMF) lipoprotein